MNRFLLHISITCEQKEIHVIGAQIEVAITYFYT